MLYEYDDKVDMITDIARTITCPEPYDPFKTECCEVTLTGFIASKTYYFAATAYDDDNNESVYSIELSHTFKPGELEYPINLRWKND
jgi:hypothetical protein